MSVYVIVTFSDSSGTYKLKSRYCMLNFLDSSARFFTSLDYNSGPSNRRKVRDLKVMHAAGGTRWKLGPDGRGYLESARGNSHIFVRTHTYALAFRYSCTT